MDLVEQFHIFGLTNIHTFGSNNSLSRPFSLMLNYAKPQMITDNFMEIVQVDNLTCNLCL